MQDRDDTARLLPIDVAARSLGLPIKWFRRQIDEGHLPVIRAGNRRLVDVDQIRQTLRDRAERGGTADG
jgi:hypothetical protein